MKQSFLNSLGKKIVPQSHLIVGNKSRKSWMYTNARIELVLVIA